MAITTSQRPKAWFDVKGGDYERKLVDQLRGLRPVLDEFRANERRGKPLTALDVTGPDRGRKPVLGIVGQPDGLLLVGHLHHRQCRPERLLGDARHRGRDVSQHGRLEEETLIAAFATG